MIIDVIDLKLENLKFKSSFDRGRYNRGESIYNREKVNIEKVEKNDEDSYYIEATVEGTYDYYETTLTINNNIITDCTCTCQDYFKGNKCKHILATSMEVFEPHDASTREGRKRIEKQRAEEAKKRLELLRQKQEEERKRREYESKYYYGLQTIDLYKPKNSTNSNSNTLNISALYQQSLINNNTKKAELANSITIEPKLELVGTDTLKLSFKIGQSRMYVLKNIKDFYQAYKQETELDYGKQLRFIPKRENFNEESQKIFDLIIEHAELAEYIQKFNRYNEYDLSGKEIYISGKKIEETINLLEEPIISAYSYSEGDTEYEFTDEKINIECSLSKEMVERQIGFWEEKYEETEEYVLRLNISDYNVLFSNDHIYIFYKKKIYKMDKDKELVKLFNLFNKTEEILIPEDRLEDFTKYVAPKIKFFNSSSLPDTSAKEGVIVNKLASKVLLDIDEKGNIILELKFCYGDFEFNILEKGYKKYVEENNIVRDIPAETEVINRIFSDGFEWRPEPKYFILKNEESTFEFLLYKIQGYMNDFEVLATDKFKNKQIKQPKISNIGIKLDNGLLELDISKMNIDISEIKDILKDYKIKKKYHKLKSGDFLELGNNEDLNLLEEMETTLDIDYGKINNGMISLPINRSLYLEKLMNSRQEINVSKNEKYSELINNIENSEISEKIKINENFEKILRDYQKIGYKWLKTLETYQFGGILADDMGLGKTIQIIALLKSEVESESQTTSIVVCPSTLVLNWKAEVEKWCGEIKVLIIRGTAEERIEELENYQDYDLVITSYDLLKRDIENYENKRFKYIIADEAQYIKNSSTQNATSLKSLNGEIKFALTGTPIENSIAELWSIFDFVMPGYLYNYHKFKKKFEEPILKYEDTDALTKLKKLISPFILRRVKSDVLTELPEKNITVMKNEMESEQEKIYLSYLAQTKKEVLEELNDNGFEKSKFKILMLLTRLRQICCHPGLFIENYKGGSGKLSQCLDLITDAIESGHKLLLFSSYTSMFEIIEKELNKLNINYFKLVGDTPVSKRIEMVDEFNNNESIKVFLISLKAGGTGLNLTSADVVIHYDPWWNVSSENQATDRAYRIGQKNSVQVYKLITSNSIEEKINKMQERKEKLSKDILSTEETFINTLSKKDILDLFE